MTAKLFLLALAMHAGPAAATVLGGAVTGGSAAGAGFEVLAAGEGLVVGDDTFQRPGLYAFDEDQNITLDRDLRVDIGAVIARGTVVASHYVFFDPGPGTSQKGWVEFDSVVLGIATETPTLRATDFLANTDVIYLSPGLRGLEWEDRVWIDPDNPFRIRVDWIASTPGDYIRVFTAKSPGV